VCICACVIRITTSDQLSCVPLTTRSMCLCKNVLIRFLFEKNTVDWLRRPSAIFALRISVSIREREGRSIYAISHFGWFSCPSEFRWPVGRKKKEGMLSCVTEGHGNSVRRRHDSLKRTRLYEDMMLIG
jgi:hypothetical protein